MSDFYIVTEFPGNERAVEWAGLRSFVVYYNYLDNKLGWAGASDLAIIQGGQLNADEFCDSRGYRTLRYWIQDWYDCEYFPVDGACLECDGSSHPDMRRGRDGRDVGGRLYCAPGKNEIEKYSEIMKPTNDKEHGFDVFTAGAWPQTVASPDVSKQIIAAYSANQLKQTDEVYTLATPALNLRLYGSLLWGNTTFKYPDVKSLRDCGEPRAVHYPAYEYNGDKYIRVVAMPYGGVGTLRDGRTVSDGDECWVRVEPVEWIKYQAPSDGSIRYVMRDCLWAGVPCFLQKDYDFARRRADYFGYTTVNRYNTRYFYKQIMQVYGQWFKDAGVDKYSPWFHMEEFDYKKLPTPEKVQEVKAAVAQGATKKSSRKAAKPAETVAAKSAPVPVALVAESEPIAKPTTTPVAEVVAKPVVEPVAAPATKTGPTVAKTATKKTTENPVVAPAQPDVPAPDMDIHMLAQQVAALQMELSALKNALAAQNIKTH